MIHAGAVPGRNIKSVMESNVEKESKIDFNPEAKKEEIVTIDGKKYRRVFSGYTVDSGIRTKL